MLKVLKDKEMLGIRNTSLTLEADQSQHSLLAPATYKGGGGEDQREDWRGRDWNTMLRHHGWRLAGVSLRQGREGGERGQWC